MPTLDRSKFKYNAKVLKKTCLYYGTIYFANRLNIVRQLVVTMP